MTEILQRYPQLADCFSAPAVRNSPTLSPFKDLPISAPVVRKSAPNAPTSPEELRALIESDRAAFESAVMRSSTEEDDQ